VVDDHMLRYRYLNNFDAAMNYTEGIYNWLSSPQAYISLKNESDKVVVFERAGVLFIFNFHWTNSYTDYRVGVEEPGAPRDCIAGPCSFGLAGEYKIVLNSDEARFGGHDRVDMATKHFTSPLAWNGRKNFLQAYLPTRTVLCLATH
jgi:1,4-alpha-glucan branching enzyme